MKFNSHLTEAILLKRSLKFLAEVVLTNQQRMMIRCPNLSKMLSCDILGTKVWFSNAVGYHCLPTWELVEVDGGYLVGINPEIIKPLLVEAASEGVIEEFRSYRILHPNSQFDQKLPNYLLLDCSSHQCHVGIEHVTLGDDKNCGYFPESIGGGYDTIDYLINARKDGHRAILFYCVTHTGINKIKPSQHIDATYNKKVLYAIQQGVELLSYKAEINLDEIHLSSHIPVLFSEATLSSPNEG